MSEKVEVKTFCDLPIEDMWQNVLDDALGTVGKEAKKEPSDYFKRSILMSKHSPIRSLIFEVKFESIPSHITQQFSRHHIAIESLPNMQWQEDVNPTDIEHFVKTSRSDRTGVDRNTRKQTDPVSYKFRANAQGLMDASKKRLCFAADIGAIKHWNMVKQGIAKICPELAFRMQPECVCSGFCPEDPKLIKCRYAESASFAEIREGYISRD